MTKTLTEQQIRKTIENGTGKAAKVCEQKFYDKPKSLTEQWREGTIVDGWYYLDYDTQEVKVEIKDGRMYIDGIIVNRHSYGDDIDLMVIKGSVPSYNHFSQLVKKVERLQEQLKEANGIIKEYVETTPKVPNDGVHIPNYNLDNAECYLERWGVK